MIVYGKMLTNILMNVQNEKATMLQRLKMKLLDVQDFRMMKHGKK